MKKNDRINVLGTSELARDENRYLSFPDVVKTSANTLLAVYRDADIHYPADTPTTELILTESGDGGKTWKATRCFPAYPKHRPREDFAWHCARLTRMSDGRIAFLCDITQPHEFLPEIYISFSEDDGKTWSTPTDTGARGIMPDRLLELSEREWVFAYHWNDHDVGMLAEFLYATEDAGDSWQFRAKVGSDTRYSLCEASLVQLPDKSIISYMRENSFIHVPTMVAISRDNGHSWSEAKPHPTYGHRPSAVVLDNGEVALSYRNVAGQPGLSMWIGPGDAQGFSISAKDLAGNGVSTQEDGIRIRSNGQEWEGVEYVFPPLMSWEDSLRISARVKRSTGDSGTCVLRGGGTLIIDKDEVRFSQRSVSGSGDDATLEEQVLGTHALDTSVFHTYTLCYEGESISILVDNKEVFQCDAASEPYYRERKVAFGNHSTDPANRIGFQEHEGDFICSELSCTLKRKDGEEMNYSWSISSSELPNQYELDNCTQVDEETCGDWEEAGYSGLVILEDDLLFCIDYRRGEADNPYIVGHQIKLTAS